MPSLLDPLGVADMRVDWWKAVILPANWKLAQEAFLEGYHVPQTHPQLTLGHPEQYDPDSLVYAVHPHGHSSFQLRPNAQAKKGAQVGVSEMDAIIESVHLLNSGLEAMCSRARSRARTPPRASASTRSCPRGWRTASRASR